MRSYNDVFLPSFNNSQIYYYEIFDSANLPTHLTATKIAPYQVGATDNQTVDSRLDLRYSTNVFQDHQFGATIYRGGLYGGYTGDPGRVGRSYAKFNLLAPPAGLDFRVRNVDAYCLGMYTSTNASQNVSMTVGCQEYRNPTGIRQHSSVRHDHRSRNEVLGESGCSNHSNGRCRWPES